MLARTGLTVAALAALATLPLGISTAHATGPLCEGLPATIVGTSGNDTRLGTEGPDVVFLGAGNDKFSGRGGDDVVCGGPGDDSIQGGAGNDSLYGEDGNDELGGGDGNDLVVTGRGHNQVGEGPGDDTLRGGPGTDELSYLWSSIHSSCTGGIHIDTVAGTASGCGTDSLRGFDSFSLTNAADTFRGSDVIERVLSYRGTDTISTGGGNDHIYFDGGNKLVNTGAGEDTVNGGGSAQTRISLSSGDDLAEVGRARVVSGGDGNDVLASYLPTRLDGGSGSDTFLGLGDSVNDLGVYIDLLSQRAYPLNDDKGYWQLDSIENAAGSDFSDVIFGTPGDETIRGRNGNDFINGRGGHDAISGGNGDDRIIR
ncbi:MAG: calcium-binding protein [Marmoricola sp.]